ncbi:hypothetical protein ACJDU8_24515 [Clostridium sp. WILCCON 0269]|uniref:Uncharacterized protein n=1 Tax=Candidatus Clostridium eludens TaxID=3381663 RepID=A0ABW8SSV4_9CLOT
MVLENNFIVVVDHDLESQRIFYNGKVELEAFKILKELKYSNKRLFKANVKMCKIHGYNFIESFEVIEIAD